MIDGIDDSLDAAQYVGYDSLKGTEKGIMCHTISGSAVDGVYINGRETGEFGLNSALAGFYGVPSVFLAGDYAATKEAEALIGAAILIDVLPRPPKPAGLKEGTVWRPRPRSNIPGSSWLPNTGFGVLPISVEAYFRDNLTRLTEGDLARKLVF